jgi:hypothetical protein
MKLPEIPKSYMVIVLILGLIVLRIFGTDGFVTAGLSIIIGYLTGSHLEQTKTPAIPVVAPVVLEPSAHIKLKV